ncbi:hypothetical protein [Mangrovicoccus ximenensis]|uniref:hypothetical protein n=1 Tax=Mangrovicoccus ximenensis TaxID=1911570 RepID=UPI000D33E36B|nr:hypothetical protein [Mangrovicoccus ximenensis]
MTTRIFPRTFLQRAVPAAAVSAALLAAGCMETTSSGSMSSGSASFSGSTRDSGGESVDARLNPRSGGGYTLVLKRGEVLCTGVFDDAAVAGGTELASLNCTGDHDGTATVVYGGDAEPSRVVFSVIGLGGGTVYV